MVPPVMGDALRESEGRFEGVACGNHIGCSTWNIDLHFGIMGLGVGRVGFVGNVPRSWGGLRGLSSFGMIKVTGRCAIAPIWPFRALSLSLSKAVETWEVVDIVARDARLAAYPGAFDRLRLSGWLGGSGGALGGRCAVRVALALRPHPNPLPWKRS